jgi:hypothetical protein
LALVSRKDNPQVRIKYAIRKIPKVIIILAGIKSKAPVAYNPSPIRIPDLYENLLINSAAGKAMARHKKQTGPEIPESCSSKEFLRKL